MSSRGSTARDYAQRSDVVIGLRQQHRDLRTMSGHDGVAVGSREPDMTMDDLNAQLAATGLRVGRR